MDESTAGEQPVKTAPEVTIPEASQDTAAEMAAKDAEIARLAEERDNYRRAALKAKGKYREESEDVEDPEDIDALVERKVTEKLYDARLAQAAKEKEDLIQRTMRENTELRNALKNTPGRPTSSGSSQDKGGAPASTTGYWTPEQEADLIKRGLDPKSVLQNMDPKSMNGGQM